MLISLGVPQQMFQISEEESYLEIKLRYNELIRKIIMHRGVINEEDRLETLLTSLPEKYDHIKESFYAQPIAPGIDYIWDRMLDIDVNAILMSTLVTTLNSLKYTNSAQ